MRLEEGGGKKTVRKEGEGEAKEVQRQQMKGITNELGKGWDGGENE